ncbi:MULTISPECIES: Eco57I restriction-modification methylase domain-containing protein [Gordonia]|uniref:Eco57I restriction-modification methylase domain-containing protein n=1 Tax=Gordonia TaxID=2053 RepID=UPI0012BB2E3C|nr:MULTISPECIES: SAM-dependent methyltransferase [Gordonia]MDH3009266.1 SAM-dependent methyltransferase [Gordonia alkanivorans]MDH3018161.1 SAM-dependent methyltransferase [Gordonia alkanivorans]MDH3043570.1 SAM-dependent methyltransferase [Gordonia alkanivorans]MDH3048076.1 SAM-dependent methyltransferase [Gordonia alkanivorans]QGP89147.1 SAM-dependent methyltransferase [Gordonia sp. 135]
MKTADQLDSQKLRGGFYSPPALVDMCLDRVSALTQGRTGLQLLEPSAGDGAFVRGLQRHELVDQISRLSAVELVGEEARSCHQAMISSGIPGDVQTGSFFEPKNSSVGAGFDIAVGNPPFLRFQFVSASDQLSIKQLAETLGISFTRVANLWIPLFLGALARLRAGGVFAFIIPAECLTGISAKVVRDWLIQNCEELQMDMFPVGSFPGVLQEVVVLSGRVAPGQRCETKVTVIDHSTESRWIHAVSETATTWTSLLLAPHQLSAFDVAREAECVIPLGTVARLSVATVTGANDYFSYNDTTRDNYELGAWSRPLLARTRQAPGLEFTERDLQTNRASGVSTWLLDTSFGPCDPAESPGPSQYFELGEALDLHTRYKCRIRSPWYRVPVVSPGDLMLSKRSHHYPRLIRNVAGVVTTDTIYQGVMLSGYRRRSQDLVGSFHNSITLLTAELYGRSFGGGVLELVPSEIRSLLVPLATISKDELSELDSVVRSKGADSALLIDRTDELISAKFPELTPEVLRAVREARDHLMNRRLDRNQSAGLQYAAS